MPDATDIVLKQLEHQWVQARQCESQRASMTQYILVLSTALQGFIVQLQFSPSTLALGATLVFLGVYGAIVSAKYYERFRMHVCRIGRMMEWLEQQCPSAELSALEQRADARHSERHPRMSKLRLHTLWQLMHWAIAGAGLVDILVIAVRIKLLPAE